MQPLPAPITTERLTLRLWTVADAGELEAAVQANLDHLRPWLVWVEDEPLTLADRKERIRTWHDDWLAGGDMILGIYGRDQLIGGCGLHRRGGPGGLEIGYWVDADHVGRGYATEAARGLTGAALAVPGIERVEIHHDKANVASGRVAEALGYTLAEERPDGATVPGRAGITRRWVMAASDWPGGPDGTGWSAEDLAGQLDGAADER